MKNWISILCILSILSTFSFAQTQKQTKEKAPRTKQKGDAKEKAIPSTEEFTTLIADVYAAWNSLNPANAAKFYSQDADLVFYDVAPLQYKGWKAYQTGVTKMFQDFLSFKLIPNKDLTVTRKGKLAWTTLTFHLSGKQKNGTALELDGRHTA